MQILARLGDVIYWIGCGVAGLFFLAAYYLGNQPQYNGDRDFWLLMGIAACGVVAWLIGRALQYILRG